MKKIMMNTTDMNFIESAPKNTNKPDPIKPIARERTAPNLKSLIGRKIKAKPRIAKQPIVIASNVG